MVRLQVVQSMCRFRTRGASDRSQSLPSVPAHRSSGKGNRDRLPSTGDTRRGQQRTPRGLGVESHPRSRIQRLARSHHRPSHGSARCERSGSLLRLTPHQQWLSSRAGTQTNRPCRANRSKGWWRTDDGAHSCGHDSSGVYPCISLERYGLQARRRHDAREVLPPRSGSDAERQVDAVAPARSRFFVGRVRRHEPARGVSSRTHPARRAPPESRHRMRG